MTQHRWPVGGESVAYGYSTGRLRALETHLLTASELEAAVRQGEAFSWAQLLDQLRYPEDNDLLRRVADARQEADDLLLELCAERPLAYGLLLYQCYHNLKVFLKALLPAGEEERQLRLRDTAVPESVSDLLFWGSPEKPAALRTLVRQVLQGEIDVPDLPEDWKEWSAEAVGLDELGPDAFLRTRIPRAFAAAIHAARTAYVRSGEVGQIDAVLDSRYFAHLAALAHRAGHPFLRTYACLKADLANLNALYRICALQLDPLTTARYWVPGGQLESAEAFVRLLTADRSSWREAFGSTPVETLVDLAYALAHGTAEEAPGVFARRADNLILDLARTGRAVVYGPQVVAGYWLARQTEAQNLRLVLSLQAQNRKPEDLLALLREVYIHG